MHNPKLIEAMARAVFDQREDDSATWACAGTREMHREEAAAALTALCTLRPDLAAVLRGEAVVVPREATDAMASRVNGTCVTVTIDGTWAVTRQEAKRIHAALIAASPYAQETPDDR